MTNLRELRQPTQGEHVLSGKALALHNLESVRSEMAPFAFQEQLAPSPLSVQVTNLGDMLPVVFTGHVLSPGAADGGATTILYAPSESDDPAYRAAIAAAAGGATVDYFDARVSTPSVATLTQYDAVYTWANFAYSNNVLFGDNLAAYNDQGGTVILGAFCTYTTGNFLSGQIMTSGYSPVDSPFGTNHFSNSSYVGDGSTCIYDGVTSLSCTYRDFLVTQGSGVVDGHYADNEICHAYRGTSAPGQGDVIYSNGAGAVQLGCGGQWGTAVGNGSVCSVASGGAPKILYAPSEADDPSYRAAIAAASGGTVDYFDAAAFTPRAVILQGYTAVHTWANFAYHNNVAFGDRLAAAADNGRNIVLGAFCTYTNGNFLSGQIMTSAYCPVVSPSGSNHFSNATDTGPFGTCLGDGVTSLTAFYRDILVKQGAGVVDSTYDSDGEICLAYRPNPGGGAGNVVYANGSGGFPVLGSGQWGEAVANGATCSPVSLELPQCNLRLGVLGMNPSAAGCASMPIAGQTMSVSVDATPTIGSSTAATIVAVGFGGPTSGATVFGHELLVLPPFVVSTGFGTHGLPIPSQASIVGSTFSLQGGRIEADPSAIVLTNALDITVGL